MAIRNIILEGDPMLRKKSKPVREVNDHIREILEDMVETMREHYGVGLAAPQVGVMRRMFVAEGCLSVPSLEGIVVRPDHIKIKALDFDGNEQTYEFDEFYARVMCHEYDHLEGILYTDKAEEVYDPEEKYKEMAEEMAEKNEELKKAVKEGNADEADIEALKEAIKDEVKG